MSNKHRCEWAPESDALYTHYHDTEWGVPVRDDDRRFFEFIILESAQAGLSWITILRRREGYRKCFFDFDPERVARMSGDDVERLMQDASIIRNRRKIESAINNAQRFLEVVAESGSFGNFIWAYVDGVPIRGAWQSLRDIPAAPPLAVRISKDLKKRGFTFLGPTVVYSLMQATGIVNDHVVGCFRYDEV